MDFLTGFNIFIIGLVAIFFPFMDITVDQMKRCSLIALTLFVLPLIAALIGSPHGWLEVDYMEVILLQRGITSLLFALGYGLTIGMLLVRLKWFVLALLKKGRSSDKMIEN